MNNDVILYIQMHLREWMEQGVPSQKSGLVTINGQVISDVSLITHLLYWLCRSVTEIIDSVIMLVM